METSLLQVLSIAFMIGAASGAIGSFLIIKRMALIGDAFSHVALPGIALAIAYNINPFFGILSFLLFAAFLVWRLEEKTNIPAEALVGLLFMTSLALGILIIPDIEIIESLFGTFPHLTPLAFTSFLLAAVLAVFSVFYLTRKFTLMTVSVDLAAVNKVEKKYNLFFLLIFAFITALGIKLIGALLMGALTIIPALIAKNISRNMKAYILLSTFFGIFIASFGAYISYAYGFLPGPTIVILGIVAFLFSLLFAR